MGRAWGKNLRDSGRVELAAWVDLRKDAADAAVSALELKSALVTDDLQEALREARPDFVVDASVPEAHHDVTLQSLAAGIPVLGEKPMADTLDRARAMVAASESAGKLYMVSQSRRYNGCLAAYRRLVAERTGPLGILSADFSLAAHFGGFRDEMDSPLLLDMAIHTFDAARYISGADAVSVYCEEFNPPWSWYKGDACATALFTMTGGLRFVYRGSWCAEGAPTSWEATWRAAGPNGTALWDGESAPIVSIAADDAGFRRRTEESTAAVSDVPSGIAGSLGDFLHALETGIAPMGECHENIKSLAMVFAALESSRTGRRVAVTA